MDRICKVCKQLKPIEEFGIHRRYKDGKNTTCKECYNEYITEYRKRNKESIKQTQKEYYDKNREVILQKQRDRYEANPEPHREKMRQYNQKKRQEKNE